MQHSRCRALAEYQVRDRGRNLPVLNAECNNRLHCDSKAADPSYHQLRVLHSVDNVLHQIAITGSGSQRFS